MKIRHFLYNAFIIENDKVVGIISRRDIIRVALKISETRIRPDGDTDK